MIFLIPSVSLIAVSSAPRSPAAANAVTISASVLVPAPAPVIASRKSDKAISNCPADPRAVSTSPRVASDATSPRAVKTSPRVASVASVATVASVAAPVGSAEALISRVVVGASTNLPLLSTAKGTRVQ